MLHKDRHWRGQFREQHGGSLRLDPFTFNPLFLTLMELNVTRPIAGYSNTLAASFIQQLQLQVYEWEERIITLPLTQVMRENNSMRVVGSTDLPAPLRHLRWMHVRITEGARNEMLVWLDSQLEQGRLKA